MMRRTMQGRVVLVSGASGGIGAAIAAAFAARGASLMLTGRSQERLDEVAEDLRQRFAVMVNTVRADLADPAAPARVIDALRAAYNRLDILVNNAGVALPGPLCRTSVEQWDLHMAVNARAPMLLSSQALELLQQSDDAVIVNIGSVVAHKGYAGQGAYSASKHALLGLTRVLAKELQQLGVRVHLVSPGGVATPMISEMRPDIDVSELMQPEDVAEAVVFVALARGNALVDEIELRRRSSEPWK